MKRIVLSVLGLALLLTGCDSAPTVTPMATPEVAETVPAVWTDWSALTPYQPPTPKYTRRYAGFTDTLIPSDDYGPLVPFEGVTLAAEVYGYPLEESLYGLTTLTGEVVADPVFTSVAPLYVRDDSGNITGTPYVYLLTRTVMGGDGTPTARTALCAKDGSWCTDFLYTRDGEFGWDVCSHQSLLLRKGEDGLALLDLETGWELWEVDLSPYMQGPSYFIYEQDRVEGYITVTIYDWEAGIRTLLCISPHGEVYLLLSGDNVSAGVYGEGLIAVRSDSRYGYMDLTGTWVIPPAYYDANPFENGMVLVKGTAIGGNSMYYFIDHTGLSSDDPIPANYANRYGDYWYFTGGYSSSNSRDVVAVYDTYGRPVDNPLVGKYLYNGVFHEGDGWVSAQTLSETLLVRGTEVLSFPASLGSPDVLEGDRIFFARWSDNDAPPSYTLTDLAGNTITRWKNTWVYSSRDMITGNPYLYWWEDGTARYLDWDGELLFSFPEPWGALYDGYALCRSEEATTLTSPDGQVVFCWPLVDPTD